VIGHERLDALRDLALPAAYRVTFVKDAVVPLQFAAQPLWQFLSDAQSPMAQNHNLDQRTTATFRNRRKV